MTQANTMERAQDLLVLRATEGLDGFQEQEMQVLLEGLPELDADHYERAAALVHLALDPPSSSPMPTSVRKSVEAALGAHIQTGGAHVSAPAPLRTVERSSPAPGKATAAQDGRSNTLPWLVAAASLLFAAFTFLNSPLEKGPDETAVALADLEGTIELSWAAGPSERSGIVTGAVVWNDDLDQGYMEFEQFGSLAGNDASAEQYQLWIFDGDRDAARPVDGGVFDLPAEGEPVRVPIDAKLAVGKATLFAVTVERPGGVVVSAREHIVALAQL